eukprot:TCONS_00063515-protein
MSDRIARAGTLGHEEVLEDIELYIRGLARSFPETKDPEFEKKLNQANVNVQRLAQGNTNEANVQRVHGLVSRLKSRYNALPLASVNEEKNSRYSKKTVSGKKGNNPYDIDITHLKFLLSIGHNVKEIAEKGLLGGSMHRNTLTRFMKDNNIPTPRERYSIISDDDLLILIRKIALDFPNSGIREVTALLRTGNPPHIVQRDRVARLLSFSNPEATARRWAQVVPRRVYSVPTPNHLWHIDTHHSLIRWNFVIHSCIDGFSRFIIYLKIHTNNLAKTMVCDFIEGVKVSGVPSRVRADHGGEFVHVKSLMESLNGPDHNAFISGKSVHNVRIERLWRDVFCKVSNKFYNIFNIMEKNGILDIENEVHIAALHHVFGLRIQNILSTWRDAHNHHPVSTEHYKTPRQLWFQINQMESKRNTAISNIFQRDLGEVLQLLARFKGTRDLPEPDSIKKVLPRIMLPLNSLELEELNRTVSVDSESEHEGVDIYVRVLEFVARCIRK